MLKKIAIFASGTGTNFVALQQAIQTRPIAAKIALLV